MESVLLRLHTLRNEWCMPPSLTQRTHTVCICPHTAHSVSRQPESACLGLGFWVQGKKPTTWTEVTLQFNLREVSLPHSEWCSQRYGYCRGGKRSTCKKKRKKRVLSSLAFLLRRKMQEAVLRRKKKKSYDTLETRSLVWFSSRRSPDLTWRHEA